MQIIIHGHVSNYNLEKDATAEMNNGQSCKDPEIQGRRISPVILSFGDIVLVLWTGVENSLV